MPPVSNNESARLTAKHITVWLNSLFFDRLGHTCVSAETALCRRVRRRPVGCRRIAPRQPLDWFAIDAVMVGRRRGALSAALTTALLYGYGQWSYSIPSLRRLAPQILKVLKSVVAVAFDRGGRRLHVRSAHRVARANLGMDGIERHSAVQRSLCSDARHRPADIGRPARAADRDRWRRQDANDLIRELRADPANHMQILSVFDDWQDEQVGMSKTSVAQLGTFEKLAGFCSGMCVDLLIVTVPVRAEERLMQILEKLFTLRQISGVSFEFICASTCGPTATSVAFRCSP